VEWSPVIIGLLRARAWHRRVAAEAVGAAEDVPRHAGSAAADLTDTLRTLLCL